MAYINVDVEVDIEDHLDEVSVNDLQAELDRRAKKNDMPDRRIPVNQICLILDEAAQRLRSSNFVGLAYKLDEIRNGHII